MIQHSAYNAAHYTYSGIKELGNRNWTVRYKVSLFYISVTNSFKDASLIHFDLVWQSLSQYKWSLILQLPYKSSLSCTYAALLSIWKIRLNKEFENNLGVFQQFHFTICMRNSGINVRIRRKFSYEKVECKGCLLDLVYKEEDLEMVNCFYILSSLLTRYNGHTL